MSRRIVFRTLLVALLSLSYMGPVSAAPPAPAPPVRVDIPGPLMRSDGPLVAFPPVTAPDPVVGWMVDQVQESTVRQYDGDLSGEWPVKVDVTRTVTIATRSTSSGTQIENATKFVGQHLANLGLTVEYDRWGPQTAPNVIGQKNGLGSPGNIYMITAHLDDAPGSPEPRAPGADDNASGSTAVLVAANILSQFTWNCTLRFALWTGEEQGLLGSDHYAQRAKSAGENIVGVLNLDMIGWNKPGSPRDIDLHAKSSMPATMDLANQMASVITAYSIDLIPEVRGDGTGSSDHASFWKYDYNAILGIEDYYPSYHDFDPYYHTPQDQLETLDLDYFTDYVRAAVAETAHMANCLVTGTLHGKVSASHDGSAIAHAELKLKDAAGRQFTLYSGGDGRYNQAVPPGTYTADVSAYGYAGSEAADLVVGANGSVTKDFMLTALLPVATAATISLDTDEVRLTWPHVSPDTRYQVHRDTRPYFDLTPGTLLATVEAAHPPAAGETLTCRDAESGAGDTNINHFYLLTAINAAGAGLPSNGTGEFDFALIR